MSGPKIVINPNLPMITGEDSPALPLGETIRWEIGEDRFKETRYIEAKMSPEGVLEIRGNSKLVIRPNVSNSIDVEVEPR